MTLILLMGLVFLGVPIAAFLAFYMTPTVIAYFRKFKDWKTIGVVNLLVGWSIIGWLAVAFWVLWSLSAQQTVNIYTTADTADKTEKTDKTKEQNKKGGIL